MANSWDSLPTVETVDVPSPATSAQAGNSWDSLPTLEKVDLGQPAAVEQAPSGFGLMAGMKPSAVERLHDATAPEPSQRLKLTDYLLAVPQGINAFVSGMYGLADTVTVGYGKLAELAGLGEQYSLDDLTEKMMGERMSTKFKRTSDAYHDLMSTEYKRREADVQNSKGFWDAAGKVLTDPEYAVTKLIESAPSMVGMIAAVRKAAISGGTAAIEAAKAKGITDPAALSKIGKAAAIRSGTLADVAANAAIEGGSTGADTKQEILGKSHDELSKTSEDYRQLLASGLDQDAARNELADRVAALSTSIAGMIGGSATLLTGGFETRVFAGRAINKMLGKEAGKKADQMFEHGLFAFANNIGKEFGEEAAQSGGDVFGANVANKLLVDGSVDLMHGVPQAAGSGAALGGLTGGAFHLVGAAANRIGGDDRDKKKDDEAKPVNADEVLDGGMPQPPATPPAPPAASAPLALPAPTMIVSPEGTAATEGQVAQQQALEAERNEQLGITPDIRKQIDKNAPPPAPPPAPPAPPAAPAAPAVEWFDSRLKHQKYRGWLKQAAEVDMVEGGGIQVIPDMEAAKLRGESDVRVGVDDMRFPKRRTSSLNPSWVQDILFNTGLSVKQLKNAVDKALLGEPLGIRQAEAVHSVLNQITDERRQNIPYVRQELERARHTRREMRVGLEEHLKTTGGTPLPMSEFDMVAGEWFNDDEYDASWSSWGYTMYELSEQAHALGVLSDKIENILSSQAENSDIAARLYALIEAKRNEGRKPSEPGTQVGTGEVSSQPGGGKDTATTKPESPAERPATPEKRTEEALDDKEKGKDQTPAKAGVSVSEDTQAKEAEDERAPLEPAETLTFKSKKAEAKVEIHQLPNGWIVAPSFMTSRSGMATPLSKNSKVYPSREAALIAGLNRIYKKTEGSKGSDLYKVAPEGEKLEIQKIADWAKLQLDKLGVKPGEAPKTGQTDAFGGKTDTQQAIHDAEEERKRKEREAPPVESGEGDLFNGKAKQDDIEDAAHQAATSPQNNLPEPTEAQKEAGNYAKGHVTISGLDISIENPEGSKRRSEWPPLKSHYGYLKGTVGKDKDHIDIFIKPGTPEDYSGTVFVVDQTNKDGKFDEHKVMMGFDTAVAAKQGYLENYTPGWSGFGAMKRYTMPEFKMWLKDGNTKKPVALGYAEPKPSQTPPVVRKKEPFTFAIKPQGDGFILESDNGGGVVIAGKPNALFAGGNKNKVFGTRKEAELYAKTKKMTLAKPITEKVTKPEETDVAGTQVKVGGEARIMGVDSVVARTETIAGVRYDLFNGAKLAEPRAAVRVVDQDSGNVVSLKQYPTFDAAEKEFKDTIANAEKTSKVEAAAPDVPKTGTPDATTEAVQSVADAVKEVTSAVKELKNEVAELRKKPGEEVATAQASGTPSPSLRKRHTTSLNDVLTPARAIKSAAVNGNADTQVWHYQGDLGQLQFNAKVRVGGEEPSPYAVETWKEIEKARAAGYRPTNYRAGSLGTIWVLEKDGSVLTNAGAEALASGRFDEPAKVGEFTADQHANLKQLAEFFATLPESTLQSASALARTLNQTKLGERISIERDSDQHGLHFEGKGNSWRFYEPAIGHMSGNNNLPALLHKLAFYAAGDAPVADEYASTFRENDADEYALEATAAGTPIAESFVKHGFTTAAPTTTEPAKPASNTPLSDTHDELFGKVYEGTATIEEFKQHFEDVVTQEQAITEELSKLTKEAILKRLGSMSAHRYKSENKATVVNHAYQSMLDDFTLGESLSFMVGGGNYKQSQLSAIRKIVENATTETLAKFAENIKAARDERKQRAEAMLESVKDPKTLDDFETFLRVKKRTDLTQEQRERYDELRAEKSRTERKARRTEERTTVRAAGATTGAEIIATKHTQKGYDLFVVKAAERVEREVYNAWNATAKKLGGWYSAYNKGGAIPGFQFKTRESAEAFQKYVSGGDTEAVKEVAQARRDAFADDRSQTAVERLREMADRLDERADESLSQDRKENTDRRARMAASAEANANYQKSLAKTMRNVAQAIEDGKAKFLDQTRQKVQVEMLNSFVTIAKYRELRDKYKDYSEQEKHKGEAPTSETVEYAEWPTYSAYRSDLAKLGRELLAVDGLKLIGKRLLKVADDVTDAYTKFAKENLPLVSRFSTKDGGRPVFPTQDDAENAITRSGHQGKATSIQIKRGQHMIVMSPSEAQRNGIWQGDDDKRITLTSDFGAEMVEKAAWLSRRNRLSLPHQFESAAEQRKRFAAMGIETPAEFRSALREFIKHREAPPAPDKVKEMERAMIGRRKDGLDFFPTPAEASDQMIEAAGIEEGMSILEPSAGMGHIADRIREAGFQPDVVELSGDRRELLEVKGYNVVGHDFMDVKDVSYDRIIMNPPFSDRRDMQHVQHAYEILKPGGRLVALMGEGVFFGGDKKATEFREWLESVGGTDEKLEEGTFQDPSLPVNTGANARMVVIDKPKGEAAMYSRKAGEPDVFDPEWERDLNAALDRYENGMMDRGEMIPLGFTPPVLRMLGFDRLPLRISEDVVHKATEGKHSVTMEQLRQIIREIADPAAVFNSDSPTAPKGALVVLTSMEDEYGSPIVAAIHKNQKDGTIDINRIASVYGRSLKSDVARWFNNRLRYADKEKSARWRTWAGVKTPGHSNQQHGTTDNRSNRPWAGVNSTGHDNRTVGLQSRIRNRFDLVNFVSKAGFSRAESVRSAPTVSAIESILSKPGLPVATVQNIIAPVLKRWKNGPDVRVVETVEQVPESAVPSNIEGAYLGNGQVYLVASNLHSRKRVLEVLAHEAVGHAGIEELFGADLKPILNQIGLMEKSGNQTVREIAQQVDETQPGLDANPRAKEIIAVMAERGIQSSLMQRVRGAIRRFLRVIGIDLQFNDADLAAMLRAAERNMEGGQVTGATEAAAAFSIKAPTFYSQMSRAIERLMADSEPAGQIRLKIAAWAKKGEFKQEEYDWSGIDSWLADQKGKVTKEQVIDFLKSNEPIVEKLTNDYGYTEATKESVLSAYHRGIASTVIGKVTGIGETTILRWTKNAEVTRTTRETKGITSEVEQNIIDLYDSGLSGAEVAESLGVGTSTVHRIVVNAGTSRSLSEAFGVTSDVRERARKLYADERNTHEIAAELGISQSTVSRWTRQEGTARGYSDAQAIRNVLGRNVNNYGIKTKFLSEKTEAEIPAASVYELARLQQLDADPDVTKIERASDRIPYGDGRTYVPDLVVTRSDGSRIAEEIKPEYQIDDETVQAKANAATEYYTAKGMDYRLVTERTIGLDGFDKVEPSALGLSEDDVRRVRSSLAAVRSFLRKDITPAMRDSVMQGQSLFEPKPEYTIQDDLFAKDATKEQKALAHEALADLGTLSGNRRAKPRLLGSRIPAEFAEKGRIGLLGHKAATPEDLAVLAQVYRDPRFETFRIFFMKGDTVVGQTGVTSRLAGATQVFLGKTRVDALNYMAAMRATMERMGADGYYLLHNHPSGTPTPSAADLAVTQDMARDLKPFAFKGHVIINENKYGQITLDASGMEAKTVVKPMASGYRLHGTLSAPSSKPVKAHPVLGMDVPTQNMLAFVAKQIQVSDGYFVLIGRSRGGVCGIMEVPKDVLKSRLRALAVVRKFAADTGSMDVFAAGIPESEIELARQAIKYRFLRDVIYTSGRHGNLDDVSEPGYTMGRQFNRGMQAEENESDYLEENPIAYGENPEEPGKTGVLDQLLRKAGGEFLGRNITGPLYDKLVEIGGKVMPEKIKAGVVSDYGLDETYLGRKDDMLIAMRVQARKTSELVDKLGGLDRAQSRVAYQWMNQKPDTELEQSLMAQLPEESQAILRDLKKLISDLGKEAVRLGQLSAEAYERNDMSYLHRTYAKHELEETQQQKQTRGRAIRILGDQYKGRGLRTDVAMSKIENTNPDWWKRKTQTGRADTALKGQKFIRLERRAFVDTTTEPLEGMDQSQRRGRVLETVYVPAGEPVPQQYLDWHRDAGEWEARFFDKNGTVGMWRNFAPEELQRMGELDEVKYAAARTLFQMTHDVEVGRFFEWVAQNHAKDEPDGLNVVETPTGRFYSGFDVDTWVEVPTSKVPGTSTYVYGKLAGKYVPAAMWNDIRQINHSRFAPFGDVYASILKAWKASKTALSPAVHFNNVMANFMMADLHDLRSRDLYRAVQVMLAANGHAGKALAGDFTEDEAKEIMQRFEDSGATMGMFAHKELQRETMKPLVEQLRREVLGAENEVAAVVQASNVVALLASGQFREALALVRLSKAGTVTEKAITKMIDGYQLEDEVFRLAIFIKGVTEGQSDRDAGQAAKSSFLDYTINAPWIQNMRATAWPFVAFTYRALPMLVEVSAKKPWKPIKWMIVAGALNSMAYAMLGLGGDDEDRERSMLPDEKSGKVFGMIPKLIRMPWNDAHGSPVFLDIRRWILLGDIFDTGATHSAIPLFPSMVPGGPLAMVGELLANRQQFTGKALTLDTDTAWEKATKIGDYAYKSFAPNAPWIYNSYSWDRIFNSAAGRTDVFGREQSVEQAAASAFGIKLGSYPRDALTRNASIEVKVKTKEIEKNIWNIEREYARRGISADEYKSRLERQKQKLRDVTNEFAERSR